MASETMTNPRILFCDEPTSGLDSFMAFSVVDILKKLALQGKTVICTIHQPSSQIVEMFDKVLLLASRPGRTAFLGEVSEANKFLESCGFPCPPVYNPADHWVETLADPSQGQLICQQFASSVEARQLAMDEEADTNIKEEKIMADKRRSPYKASWCKQFRTLQWRSFLVVMKTPLLLQVRIFQTIAIALLMGVIFYGQEHTLAGVRSINGALVRRSF